MSLSQAKNRVLKAIGIAKETELQFYERLYDLGQRIRGPQARDRRRRLHTSSRG